LGFELKQLNFDLSDFDDLDNFALLARQDYNLGNPGQWFGSFRGGLYGFQSRIYGLVEHFSQVHGWITRARFPHEVEYHLVSSFFFMDSAIECFVFAINALGYASKPELFRDITSRRGLAQIKPSDVYGNFTRHEGRSITVEGYCETFPTVQEYWKGKGELISSIVNHHDVSKHRQTIFTGGMSRTDAPKDFYESIGVPDDPAARAIFWPMKEILLQSDPKQPSHENDPSTSSAKQTFEDLTFDYQEFILVTGALALKDARNNISLKHKKLLNN